MIDNLGNNIELSLDLNGHVLILGQTGQGKTFMQCRMIEKYCQQKKKCLIFDYSGSFTKKELEKHRFKYENEVQRVQVAREKFVWPLRVQNKQNVVADIADALLGVIKCEAYFQRKWLYQMIEELIVEKGSICISDIIQRLDNQMYEESLSESVIGNVEALGRLLTRLEPYGCLNNFYICPYESGKCDESQLVQIIELTDLPQQQRRFLTELLISLLWKEIYRQDIEKRCEVMILDEMQFMGVKDGGPVSGILREGRKRNLSAILSTQLTGKYNKAEIQTLQQAANIIFFKPSDDEIRAFAKIIDTKNAKKWEAKLTNLERGEAVLKGRYIINGRKSPSKIPIIIRT